MAKYIITLEDNAQGVAISGGAILTQEELLAGKKHTPAIALGDLLSQTACGWANKLAKEHAGKVQVISRGIEQPVIH